ncbi:MAG: hypothetical protein AB7L17_15575 [Ilumatobacteraceae bacterium]
MRTRSPITSRSNDERRSWGRFVGAALTVAGVCIALAGAITASPAYAVPDTVPAVTDSVPVTDETVPVTEPATTTTLPPTTTAAPTTVATTSTTIAPAVLPANVLPESGATSTPIVSFGALLIALGVGTIAATRARRPNTRS